MEIKETRIFKAKLNKKAPHPALQEWEVTVRILEQEKHFLNLKVEARGSEFLICLTCYYEGFGMEQWCVCVPNWGFGCKVSASDLIWNREQLEQYIENEVDRISCATAITEMLKEVLCGNK